MVTTRFQAKRRRLDMDSAIGRREDMGNGGLGTSQRQADEAKGDTSKTGPNNALPPSSKDGVHKAMGPISCCRRLINKRAKKNSFSAFKPREKNDAVRTAHDCINPESHDTFLHIGPIGEYGGGRRGSGGTIGHDYFRFRCPLGDIWHDAYADVCRHRTVKTGDAWIDKALRSIPFQGFDITHFVGVGKSSYVLAGNCSQKFLGMVAVKIIKREIKGPKDPRNTNIIAPWHVEYPEEVDIHRNLDHPNIVKWLDYMTYMQRKCIIMEFCHLGGLDELLTATPGNILTEQVAKRYFIQMVDAIEYLHSIDVVHRDIVISNWAINRYNIIKLIDFGCARRWSNTHPLMTERPPSAAAYLPPEPLFGEPYNPKCADIWAVGVVLFKMVTSSLPYGTEPVFQPGVLTALPYPKDSILPLSITLKDMLNRILHPHDVVRFTLNRIKQCDWFNEDMSKFYVSNHYLGRQPLKIKEGQLERRWKAASGLLKPEVLHKAWVPLKPKARVIRIMKLKKKVGSDQVRPCSALAIGVESARVYSDRVSEESEALPQCTSSFSAVVLQAETRNEREPAAETNDEDEDSNQ